MSSDGPIEPDASTIHRNASDSQVDRPFQPEQPVQSTEPLDVASQSVHSTGIGEIEEAKTIIRRPSSPSPPGAIISQPHDSNWGHSQQSPAAAASVLLGQRLNHFLLESFVGGGGMGAVFRARDEQLDRIVAVKVIPFVGNDADLKRRFRNEAQSAAKLDHPRIAKVFDVGTDDDWHYIVFEFIEGINIRDLVARDGVLSIEEAVFYTCQLADAIDHASQRGIVHRDIKPSNVLVGEGDTIKLVDMGLARSANFDLTEDMTASGVTLGTFDYISPEQANDPRDADVRSDLYSLGCTLYFMLAGEPPYPGGTMLQKLLHHGQTPPPDIRLLRSDVSDDLAAVLRRMLAKLPGDRYQNAFDLIADLQEVAYREDLERVQAITSLRASSAAPVTHWFQRHAPWLVSASLLLVIAGGLSLSSDLAREKFPVVVPERTTVLTLAADSGTSPSPEIPTLNKTPSQPPAANFKPDKTLSEPNSPLQPPTTVPESYGEKFLPNVKLPNESRSVADPPRIRDLPVPEELSHSTPAAIVPLPSPPKSEAANLKPLLIRVTHTQRPSDLDPSDEAIQTDQVAFASSLAEAIKMANELDINRIELAETQLRSGPLVIDRDGLVISSAVGGTVIVFETDQEDLMRRTEWIKIGSNRVEFEGLHFYYSVPRESMGGGCLISMNANRLVRLRDGSITIDNLLRHSDMVAFDIETKVEAGGSPATLPLVSIELYNVCIRGQITMLKMDVAAELQMRWENGLLAIDGRMLDTAGAVTKPSPSARPIQLLLEQVIAMAPKGQIRMRLNEQHPYPLQIDREAKNCVFLITSDVPTFEVIGTQSLDNTPPLLVLRGEANAYDTQPDLSDLMLRIVDVQGDQRLFPMSLLRSATPTWAEERSSRWAVDWETDFSEYQNISELEPKDFRQFGAVISGFREKSLTILSPKSAESQPDES